ncbi:MAG: ribonuclease R [Alphaproteobacteria bacterium]|nr:ribonuclease R [Alphaproteobacteria bacterium]
MDLRAISDYISVSPKPLTKREIAVAFGVKGGPERIALKRMLKELEKGGQIVKHAGGAYGVPEGLPATLLIEITDIDIDGDVFARPVDFEGEAPRIEIMPEKNGHPSLKIGDRVLASLKRVEEGYEARVLRRLDTPQGRVIGEVRLNKFGGILIPADKKARDEFEIAHADLNNARQGDLVLAEVQPTRRGGGMRKKARVLKVIGKRGDPRAISLISIYEAGLREEFPAKVLEAVKAPKSYGPEREDLRAIPLITIDGADARDFDDAVYAEKTDDGFHLIVAIADVAHYVRTGTALDDEAQRRGNSTYFPDRVVPMLPEILSNDLCSLRPDEDRPCLAAHLWIDVRGHLKKYQFTRALMRSHARMTYEEVQKIRDDGLQMVEKQKHIHPLSSIIDPLYAAFRILDDARLSRGALDLDLPERKILLDEAGNMIGIKPRARLDSHKLIEEFMVLANVAAAQALEARRAPCVYRIHESPSPDKLEALREFLDSFGISLSKSLEIRPANLNQILRTAQASDSSHIISQVILRAQSQARYSTENAGHFGLALNRYAHFTSPIRRYADLLVHRALIAAYDLGEGGMVDALRPQLETICGEISQTERTSMEAERNAIDRFTASFLSTQIGAEFSGRINGVTRFGLFVTLDESGADGLVPIRSLPNDFYIHEEHEHALIGRRTGLTFRLGGRVKVLLKEADGMTGSTVLELSDYPQERSRLRGPGKDSRYKKGNNRYAAGPKRSGSRKPKGKRRKYT